MHNYNYYYADIPAQPFPQSHPFPGVSPGPFSGDHTGETDPSSAGPGVPVPPVYAPHPPSGLTGTPDLPQGPETSLDEELARFLDTLERPVIDPQRVPQQRQHRHRKRGVLGKAVAKGSERVGRMSLRRGVSTLVALLTAVIVLVMGVLGGMVSYAPLRALAGGVDPQGLEELWPLLVYGPWVAGALSVLRASLTRQRARHAWCVVVLFSGIAVMLCTVHAPLTLPGLSVAALPPVTVLLSFHQLVRQIDPTEKAVEEKSGHARRGGAHRQPLP